MNQTSKDVFVEFIYGRSHLFSLSSRYLSLSGQPGVVTPIPQGGSPGGAGSPGSKGQRGEPGPPGRPGIAGNTGPSGPVGSPGFVGSPGPQGIPGRPGRPGIDGSPGSPGMSYYFPMHLMGICRLFGRNPAFGEVEWAEGWGRFG